jgi:hypothetical protein
MLAMIATGTNAMIIFLAKNWQKWRFKINLMLVYSKNGS